MSDFNANNYQYSAPQQAPAAPEKKPIPTKLIAIAAAALAAIILLIVIISGSIPGDVKDEIKKTVEDSYGYEVKGLDSELKISAGDVKVYIVSGKLKGECDDDFEDAWGDYEKGYFVASVVMVDDDVVECGVQLYEKDDKDDMKDDIKDFKKEYKKDKKEYKEQLESMGEMYKGLKGLEGAEGLDF